ncbi:MAG: OsmC family protein [Myxococcales bacterium]|nr:OsmC family protein [Myxococcales bacterium]
MSIRSVSVSTAAGKFGQRVQVGGLEIIADEPKESGGDDLGLAPHELVLAGLGACTSMTLKLYADRKGWPLERAEVTLDAERTSTAFAIRRRIQLHGPLDADQRARLLEIASKCPVHKTLTGEIAIESTLVDAPPT